ncbi:unnamed protein product [Ascophyllum nodosum]
MKEMEERELRRRHDHEESLDSSSKQAVRSSTSLGSVEPLCARIQSSEPGDFLRETLICDHGPLFSSGLRGSTRPTRPTRSTRSTRSGERARSGAFFRDARGFGRLDGGIRRFHVPF